MRIEAMEIFVNVADLGSISKVARKYSIPQQSISSMMKTLENDLQVKLFYREGKSKRLTAEGQVFYSFCEDFFREKDLLLRRLDSRMCSLGKKKLIVATQNNIAQTIIPKWLSDILKIDPEIDIEIKIDAAEKIVQDITNYQVDIGFILLFEKEQITWPILPEEITFQPLFSSKPYIWVNRANPLAEHKTIHMKNLEPHTVIQDQSSDLELFHFIFEEYFQLNLQYFKAANPRIMEQLVRENMAICPDLKPDEGQLALATLFHQNEDVVALPLSKKDDYKLITGYLINKSFDVDHRLIRIFDLLK